MFDLFKLSALGVAALLAPLASIAAQPAQQAHDDGQPSLLQIGDPAPPIRAAEWLKGEPVVSFEAGHVYVVEFWASWCVPCIAGMPHLSELQRLHEGDVTIIGMNIWEEPDVAAEWMSRRGVELMDYAVALQSGEEMETLWMDAAGQRGIPTAFIVDGTGMIVWIGHPNDLDHPLASVIQGDWDHEAYRDAFESGAALERRQRAAISEFEVTAKAAIEPYMEAVEAKDLDAIDETATVLIALRPPGQIAGDLFGGSVHRMLTGGRAELTISFMKKNLGAIEDSPEQLVQFGRAIVLDDLFEGARDADLAIVMLNRASELSENADAATLGLLARAHVLKAAQLQRQAVEHTPEASRESRVRTLQAYAKSQLQQE